MPCAQSQGKHLLGSNLFTCDVPLLQENLCEALVPDAHHPLRPKLQWGMSLGVEIFNIHDNDSSKSFCMFFWEFLMSRIYFT